MSGVLDAAVLDRLPPVRPAQADALAAAALRRFSPKLVVLDDDPTGVQTVHGVSVYTDWSRETLLQGLREDGRLFFVLTNSRSLTPAATEALHRTLAHNLAAAGRAAGREAVLLSRGDSTLRGHWPLETETLRQTLEAEGLPPFDGEILLPCFPEGGRCTLGNVHEVREGAQLLPVGETEFARDGAFGYAASDLPGWCQEKSGGRWPADGVCCIPVEQLRALDVSGVTKRLLAVKNFEKVAVNAADYADVKVFCAGLLHAMAAGKHFLFRSAAALPKVLGGVPDRPLLTREELGLTGAGTRGLVVVGSHVEKTTR